MIAVRPSIDRAAPTLADAAGRMLGVPSERIFNRDRHATVALARQLAMAAARRHGYSLPEIGQAFDREHTTVLHAERTVAARAAADPRFADLLERIAAALTPARPGGAEAGQPQPAMPELPPPPSPRPVGAARARRTSRRHAAPRRLLSEVVGRYRTAGGDARRIVLAVRDGGRVLIDRGEHDERVIERFGASAGLLQVAAVASGYLDEARRLGRPVVAFTTSTEIAA